MSFSLYEDFSRYPDTTSTTPMAGQSPIIGPLWGTSGANLPEIKNGFLIAEPDAPNSDAVGYLYNFIQSPIAEVGCEVSFVGTGTPQIMTMAISPDPMFSLTNLLHFNFGPAGFALSIIYHTVSPAVTEQYPLNAADWNLPMKTDGTMYRLKMAVRGNSVAIFGPNGEVYGATDPRISVLDGGQCFWEPGVVNGLISRVSRCWASCNNKAHLLDAAATTDDFASLGNYFQFGRAVGALNKMGEVDIGLLQAQASFPQIQFGPTNLNSSLAAAASVNDTSVSTVDYFPVGTSITIDPGANEEVRVVSTVDGGVHAGPWQLTVAALTRPHESGVAVVVAPGTVLSPSMRYTMLYNQVSQSLILPYNVVVGGTYAFVSGGPLGPGLYLDGGFKTVVTGAPAGSSFGVVRLAASNAFATGHDATTNRPSPSDVGVGAQFYDTTLNKPIWSDGASWRDAAGNVV